MKTLGAVIAVVGALMWTAPVVVAAQTNDGAQACKPGDKLETDDGSPADCLATGKPWKGRVDGVQAFLYRGKESERIRFTARATKSYDQTDFGEKAFCKPIVTNVVAAGWTAGPLEPAADSSDASSEGATNWVEYTFPTTGDYEVALSCRVIGVSADVTLVAERR